MTDTYTDPAFPDALYAFADLLMREEHTLNIGELRDVLLREASDDPGENGKLAGWVIQELITRTPLEYTRMAIVCAIHARLARQITQPPVPGAFAEKAIQNARNAGRELAPSLDAWADTARREPTFENHREHLPEIMQLVSNEITHLLKEAR